LSVGIEEMDDEHKKLISLMNELSSKCETVAPKSEIGNSLEGLVSFARKHFAAEEALMTSIHYPDLEKHRRAHADLMNRLETEEKKFRFSEKAVLDDGFFSFLQFWIRTHIQGNDSKYGFFSNNRPD